MWTSTSCSRLSEPTAQLKLTVTMLVTRHVGQSARDSCYRETAPLAPSWPSRSAMAKPMPAVDPVMTATLPSKRLHWQRPCGGEDMLACTVPCLISRDTSLCTDQRRFAGQLTHRLERCSPFGIGLCTRRVDDLATFSRGRPSLQRSPACSNGFAARREGAHALQPIQMCGRSRFE